MSSTTAETEVRELDRRVSDGIDIRLLWSAETGRIWVDVCDTRADSSFELDVSPDEALEAFRHPYAYAG